MLSFALSNTAACPRRLSLTKSRTRLRASGPSASRTADLKHKSRKLACGLVDDVKSHFRYALIDHSYTFSG
jgi:hypothetical protein